MTPGPPPEKSRKRIKGAQVFQKQHGVFRLLVPSPAFQLEIRYVFIQKKYVFSMLLLKKFLAALLVGHESFPALKESQVFEYTTFYYS